MTDDDKHMKLSKRDARAFVDAILDENSEPGQRLKEAVLKFEKRQISENEFLKEIMIHDTTVVREFRKEIRERYHELFDSGTKHDIIQGAEDALDYLKGDKSKGKEHNISVDKDKES